MEKNMSAVLDYTELDCVDRFEADCLAERSVVDLVLDAQAGDRDALEELIRRHQNYVNLLASQYVSNRDDAAEIAQEVFILIVRRLDQLQVPAAFSSWLRRITHRTAINYCRRRKVAFAVEPESLDANVGKDRDPASVAEASEMNRQLHKGLARLNDCDRKTLVAFYLNDQSLVEMAQAFNAPIGTIKRRLHVARKRLAKEMTDPRAI
jgi:RNA polymerase sigma-70 factor (ECF subfamily)